MRKGGKTIRSIVILEPGDGIRALLQAMGISCPILEPPKNVPLRCETLLLSPRWEGAIPRGSCRFLLTPSELTPRLEPLRRGYLVSVGLSPRESIGFSGRCRDGLILSLRRELPLPGGGRLEPQDLPMACPEAPMEDMLFACAAALLLGQREA